MTKDEIKTYAKLLQDGSIAMQFLETIDKIREQETKEVLTHEKIEHVKAVKAVERILARLRELEKSVLTHI